MPASAAYLTKYLSASNNHSVDSNAQSADFEESSRPKKRRKKDKSASNDANSLLIADDDEGLLLSTSSRSRNKHDGDGEDENPLVYNTAVRSAEFRKKKNSEWRAVQGQEQDVNGDSSGNAADVTAQSRRRNGIDENGGIARNGRDMDEEEVDEATKILNAAAQESAMRNAEIEDEDRPTIVSTTADTPNPENSNDGPRMSSGARAGLQTASDTAALNAALAAREETEKASTSKSKSKKSSSSNQVEEQTIYRDASGRRIDLSQRRSQAAAEAAAKALAEKKARDDAMGEVQVRQREEARRELDEAKFLTLGRDVEDTEMNETLKGEMRWDDPMAAYMAEREREKELEEGGKRGKSGKGQVDAAVVVRSRKKEYTGAAPPNRYGIKPGWRWDGVDRGNGFEKEWFQARGKKERIKDLEYQWAYDE